jgi:uncharacterized protein
MRSARAAGARNTFLALSVLRERFAVCRLDRGAEILAWAVTSPFYSVTRTPDELSVVCPERDGPSETKCERGWRALKLEGPFDLALTGILVSVAEPLAEAGVGVFAIATYDTDYVLVSESQLERASSVLSERGHVVRR